MKTLGKVYANHGVARNKKPLHNIIYTVELSQLKNDVDKTDYEKFKFKDLGYLILLWKYEGKNSVQYYHGLIEPDKLKLLIGGEKQWSKFCQGKREFIIQRRIDGKNTPTGL